MLMTRVGKLDRQCANLGLANDREDIGQGHVAIMGAVIVTPAYVQTNALGRNVHAGLIDSIDVNGDGILEFLQGRMLPLAVTLHGQIGAIELQHVTALVNEFVFLLHLARHGAHIGFVAVVELVAERSADDAGACGGHEGLGVAAFDLAECAVEHVELALGGRQIGVAHLGIGSRRIEHLRHHHATVGPYLAEIRIFGKISEGLALADAAEALQTLANIGLETNPRLLAVVNDIHGGINLCLDTALDTRFGELIEALLIDLLARLLGNQQVRQFALTRQAADVRGQNALVAVLHRWSAPVLDLLSPSRD